MYHLSRRRAPPPALECPGGCSATAQVVQVVPRAYFTFIVFLLAARPSNSHYLEPVARPALNDGLGEDAGRHVRQLIAGFAGVPCAGAWATMRAAARSLGREMKKMSLLTQLALDVEPVRRQATINSGVWSCCGPRRLRASWLFRCSNLHGPGQRRGSALGPLPADTGKRPVQLPDAGSPPHRAAAPHGPQFLLLVLKEDEDKSYTSTSPAPSKQ